LGGHGKRRKEIAQEGEDRLTFTYQKRAMNAEETRGRVGAFYDFRPTGLDTLKHNKKLSETGEERRKEKISSMKCG